MLAEATALRVMFPSLWFRPNITRPQQSLAYPQQSRLTREQHVLQPSLTPMQVQQQQASLTPLEEQPALQPERSASQQQAPRALSPPQHLAPCRPDHAP